MKRGFLLTLLSIPALSVAFSQIPEGSGAEWAQIPTVLKKALDNASKHRYTGTRVVEFRRQGEQTRYTEVVMRDGQLTRIDYPTGTRFAGQIIVENARERRHFFPDKNEIWVMPPRREEALGRLAKMVSKQGKYKISTGDSASVAGVKTSQVIVADGDGNVVQRIFIEPRTGLMLKRQIFDPVGAQVGLYEFTKINLSPKIDPNAFRFERKGAKIVRPIDLLRDLARTKSFKFAFLKQSSGFNLYFSHVQQIDGKDVLMQFYGSDNGRLSLYQTTSEIDPAKLSRQGRDQVNTYTWEERGATFVLVGNQDQETLKRLASKVAFGN